ncbi:MAG: YceI family protein [Leptospiraceae bacterium]|nr:YceI family protein [Leptospiraceae bacterium]
MKYPGILIFSLLFLWTASCSSEVNKEGVPEAITAEATKASISTEGLAAVTIDTTASKLEFIGAKVTGDHLGGFKDWTATAWFKGDELQAVDLKIQTASIYTDKEKLTGHLQSPDFFDAAKYPEIRLIANQVSGTAPNLEVSGDLSMHGVTRSVRFPVSLQKKGAQWLATSEFTINRFDWGLQYPGKPDDLIRNKVLIRFSLSGK